DPLAALLLQVLHRFDVLPELLGDRGHRLTGAFLLVGGKPLEFLIGQRLAVSNRRDREAGRRAHQPDVLAARLLLQPLERRAMPVLELLVDLRDAVAVVLALERGGNGFTQLVDETFHVAPQRRPLARRELQRQRLALVVEVVDVAPVRRIADRRRVALQEFLDGGVPVTAGRAEDEDVEAVLTDMHAEVERLERAVLADRDVEVLELGGRRGRQRRRVAASIQRVRLEAGRGCRSKSAGHGLRESINGRRGRTAVRPRRKTFQHGIRLTSDPKWTQGPTDTGPRAVATALAGRAVA